MIIPPLRMPKPSPWHNSYFDRLVLFSSTEKFVYCCIEPKIKSWFLFPSTRGLGLPQLSGNSKGTVIVDLCLVWPIDGGIIPDCVHNFAVQIEPISPPSKTHQPPIGVPFAGGLAVHGAKQSTFPCAPLVCLWWRRRVLPPRLYTSCYNRITIITYPPTTDGICYRGHAL